MSYSRIDCFFYRGKDVVPDKSAYVALNPWLRPGAFAMAGASAVRRSIGSHVAVKLALENFVMGVQDSISSGDRTKDLSASGGERSLAIVEHAFKVANQNVYDFGHKLAAGGRLSTSLIAVMLEGELAAAGRAGQGSAYLYRDGEAFPFFEVAKASEENELYLGASTLTPVDLASVTVRDGDVLFVSERPLRSIAEQELPAMLGEFSSARGSSGEVQSNPCETVVRYLFDDYRSLGFAMIACVGPRAIYLSRAAHAQ